MGLVWIKEQNMYCLHHLSLKNQKPPLQLYAICICKTAPEDTINMSAAHMHL